MDVLIRGMEMPLTGRYLVSVDNTNGRDKTVLTVEYMHRDRRQIVGVYELVPVPYHGRLIDADAFAAEMKKRREEAGKWLREAKDHDVAIRADAVLSFLSEVKLTLDKATTIIPATEAKDK